MLINLSEVFTLEGKEKTWSVPFEAKFYEMDKKKDKYYNNFNKIKKILEIIQPILYNCFCKGSKK